ncbi:MAG: hypothetical protein LBQ66_12365 [Planctomycetaceae bacterium]|jgi:hypothetical protein|nr:hypothetical protein [Planctomycetaceae bacterium]
MKKRILISLCVVVCCAICAVIYAQLNSNPSVPQVELNARFVNADQNGDGVLSKEEFENYFAKINQQSTAKKGCSGTGQTCGLESGIVNDCCGDGVKSVVKSVEKNCCSEKKADTVQVKFSKDANSKGEEKGCCGGKDKAKTADAKSVEKNCCNEKKADTVQVKFSKDANSKGEEKGCCGGKDKAKTADAKSGEKGCCSEKKADTVQVKFSKDANSKGEEKGCCGGKDKAKTADAKSGEKGCCDSEAKKETSSETEIKLETKSETQSESKAVTPTTSSDTK